MRNCFIAALLLTMLSPALSAFYDQPAFTYEGAFDYAIVSKSLLADNMAQSYEDGVHQGDTSLGVAGTTAILNDSDLPPDAYIEKALLVWVVSKDDSDKNAPGDNTVTMITPDGIDHEVKATLSGNGTTPASLEFEAYYKSGYYYYLYRTDVTEIIKAFQNGDGTKTEPLSGHWTVKGVDDIYDCVKDKNHAYCSSASMVGTWQLVLIYQSKNIARKRLYFYYGQDWSSSTLAKPLTINITGFELPDKATVKLSVVTSDGDDVDSAKEYLKIQGNLATQALTLADKCNPPDLPFNNKFLTYNYKNEPSAECFVEFSYDVDMFLLQYDPADTSGLINNHILYGTTSYKFMIGTGSDILLTNYVIMSVDTKLPAFDIPGMDEKFLLTGSKTSDLICSDRPFGYQIYVENHGQAPASNVMVQDTVPQGLKYVAGSTQIDRTGTGTCFEPLDDVGGTTPLDQGVLAAETLDICQDSNNCPRVLLRFKAEPENPSKNAAYLNRASIWDENSGFAKAYLTNQGMALRTKVDFECDATKKDPYPEGTECNGSTTDSDNTGNDSGTKADSDSSANTDTDSAKITSDADETGTEEITDDSSGCGCSLI